MHGLHPSAPYGRATRPVTRPPAPAVAPPPQPAAAAAKPGKRTSRAVAVGPAEPASRGHGCVHGGASNLDHRCAGRRVQRVGGGRSATVRPGRVVGRCKQQRRIARCAALVQVALLVVAAHAGRLPANRPAQSGHVAGRPHGRVAGRAGRVARLQGPVPAPQGAPVRRGKDRGRERGVGCSAGIIAGMHTQWAGGHVCRRLSVCHFAQLLGRRDTGICRSQPGRHKLCQALDGQSACSLAMQAPTSTTHHACALSHAHTM